MFKDCFNYPPCVLRPGILPGQTCLQLSLVEIWSSVANKFLVSDPTVRLPWFQPPSLNLVDVELLPHWRRSRCSKPSQIANGIIEHLSVRRHINSCTHCGVCLGSKFGDDLTRLRSFDDDAVAWPQNVAVKSLAK